MDLLRTLLGDDGVDPELVAGGVPSCAITVLENQRPLLLASAEHLHGLPAS